VFQSSKKRVLRVVLVLALYASTLGSSGCSESSDCGSVWGGYTECEAKDTLKRARPILNEPAPETPMPNPLQSLYPSDADIDYADLHKVTVDFRRQKAWEYRHPEKDFCLYVWKDSATDAFATHAGPCHSE
jgi:hypothetical protein